MTRLGLAPTTWPVRPGEVGTASLRWAAGTPRLSGGIRNQSYARRAHTLAGTPVVEGRP